MTRERVQAEMAEIIELERADAVPERRTQNGALAAEAERARAQDSGGPTEEQLAEAKEKLDGFLGGKRGDAAVAAIFAEADEDRDELISRDELTDFLKTIGLGNFVTRGLWAKGIMKELVASHGASASGAGPEALKSFLTSVGLG